MFRQSNDSAAFARQLLDFESDANQAKLLSTKAQYVMVNCHRQVGQNDHDGDAGGTPGGDDAEAGDCGGVGVVAAVDGTGEQVS